MNELALRELALFAGIGGGLLASRLLGHRVVAAVEIEPYCREVLMRRQRDGLLPMFPIWDDVRTFDGRPWRGVVDLISAGFPCTPWSAAGKRKGQHDERNLWPDTLRVIREVQPAQVFLENVPGLLFNPYFRTILADLREASYDTKWPIIYAAEDEGAPHKRERLWILANASGDGCGQAAYKKQRRELGVDRCGAPVANVDRARQSHAKRSTEIAERERIGAASNSDWWKSEPGVVRVVHELPNRLVRVRGLGNAQVPIVAATAWRILNEQ